MSKYYLIILKLAIILPVSLWAFNSFQLSEIIGAYSHSLFLGVFAAQIPLWGGMFLSSYRYKCILNSPNIPQRDIHIGIILSTGLNHLLPARLAEFITATYLNTYHKGIFVDALSATAVTRLTDVFVISLIGALSLGVFLGSGNTLTFVVILIAVLLVVIFFSKGQFVFYQMLVFFGRGKIRAFVEQGYKSASSMISSKRFYYSLLVSCFIWLMNGLIIVLFLYFAGSIPLTFTDFLVVFLASIVGFSIAFLPGSLGTFEAAVGLALHNIGYSFSEALILVVSLRMSKVIVLLPVVFLILFKKDLGIKCFLPTKNKKN